MGSITYDFLGESFLFNERDLSDGFRRFKDSEVKAELRRYREFCDGHMDELIKEIPSEVSGTMAFAGKHNVPVEKLTQTALYLEGHILDDQIYAYGYEKPEIHYTSLQAAGQYAGEFIREDLCKALRYHRELAPMVMYDYVKFLPVSKIHEPSDPDAIRISNSNFRKLLPDPIREFFHQHAVIHSYRDVSGRGHIQLRPLEPCRQIMIEFKDHGGEAFPYILFEADFKDGKPVGFVIPEHLPEDFEGWVEGSVNQASHSVFTSLVSEVSLALKCNSTYFARTPFLFNLLKFADLIQEDNSIPTFTASTLLDLDVPILPNADMDRILYYRTQDGEAFKNFRDALEKGFRELRLEKDPDQLKMKTENLLHELTEVGVHQVENQIKHLTKSALISDAGIAALTLCSTIASQGASILAGLLAGFSGYKTWASFRQQVKNNPSYLLWRVKQ